MLVGTGHEQVLISVEIQILGIDVSSRLGLSVLAENVFVKGPGLPFEFVGLLPVSVRDHDIGLAVSVAVGHADPVVILEGAVLGGITGSLIATKFHF